MLKRICPICKSEFRTFPSQNCRFCSHSCASIAQRTRQPRFCIKCGKQLSWSAKGNLCKHCLLSGKAVRAIKNCAWCGKEFQTRQWRVNQGKAIFCSKECQSASFTLLVGDKSPKWRGGLKPRYWGKFWQVIRLWALERSHYCCEMCGANEKRLIVHHLNPYYKARDVFEASSPSALQVLCNSCHAKVENLGKTGGDAKDERDSIQE